jgi:glycyl-tRNA synthetase beta chain
VIAHGNGKVVRARLSDAVHFWKTDQADLPDLGKLTASAEKLGLDLKSRSTSAWPASTIWA